ncbi:MAG: 30S ribosomal protein S24e [Promethearchaeota archaeon]
MKISIENKVDNQLLHRQDITFHVDHSGSSTPKRLEVRAKLAALLNCQEDLLYIIELSGVFGRGSTRGYARLYPSKEAALTQEYKHIIKRHEPKEEESS